MQSPILSLQAIVLKVFKLSAPVFLYWMSDLAELASLTLALPST